jgi:hypothetical protein
VITRNERAGIDDRWHKRVKDPNGTMRTERSAVYRKPKTVAGYRS